MPSLDQSLQVSPQPVLCQQNVVVFITQSGQNFVHATSVGASQMTRSKRCDVLNCFLFVVVAGHVCVCVCVLGSQLYVFALRVE